MKVIFDWLRWFFSNSGAIARGKETIDPQTSLIYTMARHPLTQKVCPYCDGIGKMELDDTADNEECCPWCMGQGFYE